MTTTDKLRRTLAALEKNVPDGSWVSPGVQGRDVKEACRAALAAQPSREVAGVPAGWKLVPVKLTQEMFEAAAETVFEVFHKQWEAVIDATPPAPAPTAQDAGTVAVVTRQSAARALNHLSLHNGPGRLAEASAMLAAPSPASAPAVEAETVACPHCDGVGSAIAPDDQDDSCDHCDGTGRIGNRTVPAEPGWYVVLPPDFDEPTVRAFGRDGQWWIPLGKGNGDDGWMSGRQYEKWAGPIASIDDPQPFLATRPASPAPAQGAGGEV